MRSVSLKNIINFAQKRGVPNLDLLRARDSAECDFCKPSLVEGAVCNSSDHLKRFLYNSHTKMIFVVNQPSNIFSWHLWELFLKNILQPSQNYHVLLCIVVIDNPKFNNPFTFF